MENLFEIRECPERFKVHLAAYQLEKEVEFWWGTVKPRVGEPVLTWNQLKALMDTQYYPCLLYTSPSPRDGLLSRMPSSA